MIKMFHVEQKIKTLFVKGFFVFFAGSLLLGCVTPRHTVEVGDYLILEDGKQVLGKEKGLKCFFFENNQRKQPFQQFVTYKYGIGGTEDLFWYVKLDGKRYKCLMYSNDELMKYYDLSQFMVSNVETEVNRVGSTANFLGISVVDDFNEDCLSPESLFQNAVLKYLKDLKFEYNNY